MRKTFAVGRLTPKSAEIVLVGEERDRKPAPFPGPWTLQAVVRHLRPRAPLHAGSRAVH